MGRNPWKDSATVMVFARDRSGSSRYDYKILIFTRTEATSYHTKNLSFPGGKVDPSDESPQWTSFLKHHKIPTESIRRQLGTQKPFIFDPQDGKIEREISLRLTAIRETFEELGIVLCSPASATSRSSPFTDYFHSKDLDIPFWQRKIHNSEATLMNFCDKFSLVPNILGLYEWTVWLSPAFSRRRFETAVFVAFLEDIPPCYPEGREVQNFVWTTPEDILEAHHTKSSWLPPPIFCEIHRFLHHESIDEMANFARQRNGRDVPLMHAASYFLKDCGIFVYPGDDLYPKDMSTYEINYDVLKFSHKTFEELKKKSKNFYRIKFKDDMYSLEVLCNINDGVLPIGSGDGGIKARL